VGRFEFVLGVAEFLVLHFQLNLVDLQLVHKVFCVFERHAPNLLWCSSQEFLRLLPQPSSPFQLAEPLVRICYHINSFEQSPIGLPL
jgi:hypothetical protein